MMALQFGVLRGDGRTERAIFIIDPDGIIRYVDVHDIDDQPDNEVLFAELHKINPDAAGTSVTPKQKPTEELPHGGVVMYCRDWCPDCRLAKQWLDKHGISYREVNIDRHPLAKKQLQEWTGGDLITPSFDIDGTIVIDYDLSRLTEVLGVKE